jgi:hypothetical protein
MLHMVGLFYPKLLLESGSRQTEALQVIERGGNMIASIKLDNTEVKQVEQIVSFFRKSKKIRYNKKLTGKVRLYISDKNSMKSMNDVLSLYENSLN